MTHPIVTVLFAVAALVSPRPPGGVDVDERRVVPALARAPAKCFSYSSAGGSLIVDAPIVESARSAPRMWQNEQERATYVHALRSRELVAHASLGKDAFGCSAVSPGVGMSALQLMVDEAEAGRAAIVSRARTFSPRLSIHYIGKRCGPMCGIGIIKVGLPGTPESVVEVVWWQA